MSRPSKRKGTRGENKATCWLARLWPKAERRALRGINDAGDIAGTPFVVEVKNAERWDVHQWLVELRVERMAGSHDEVVMAPGFLMVRRNHHPWTFIVPEDVMDTLLASWKVVNE